MKILLLLVCAVIALAVGLPVEENRNTDYVRATPPPVSNMSRGCIYILGRCARACDEGTHAYTTGCGYLKSERTCDNPVSTVDTRGKICDYSRCECDEPKVKDLVTGKCVLPEDCPKREAGKGENSNDGKQIETRVEDTGDRV